jgi:hypothetical protein
MKVDEAVRHWRAAEERLYTVVMVRPDLYMRSVELVRAVADRLRSESTEDELVQAYGRASELVAEVVRASGLPSEELDLGLVAGAAFRLRHQEIVSESHRAEAIRRIREGRERGERWVVLYETGSGYPPMPYRRLEMHLPSGVGLHACIEADPATLGPRYSVEAVRLDPATGDWLAGTEPVSERQTFATAGEWREAVEALRARLDR